MAGQLGGGDGGRLEAELSGGDGLDKGGGGCSTISGMINGFSGRGGCGVFTTQHNPLDDGLATPHHEFQACVAVLFSLTQNGNQAKSVCVLELDYGMFKVTVSLTLGEQVHAQVLVSGIGSDPFVNAALVDMYSKNGYLESAFAVFRCCLVKDVVMINSMVSSYVSFGAYEEAVQLFVEAIRVFDFKPINFSFSSLIKACSKIGIKVGEQLHGFIMKTGLDSSCFVGTSFLDMYGSFGDI
ncbi:putative pentatricopeptide repeat-containing protein At3g23330 [Typha angustifolia]|uniref:putative pentatricopeptide repeat-containing protein At3g23330 n=1 Tax=Typha angustifolia TaxID=59011 RepID=UPI003C2F9D0A